MDVSVIMVTLNGKDMTLECLKSVPPSAKGLAVEVLVVDNGSTDGTPAAVAAAFPNVRIIENGSNRGYAAAANQGMREASGRTFVLLNNDARLPEGGLAALVHFLRAHPETAVAGPQLIHEDGRLQHSFDTEPCLATELLNKSLLRRCLPGSFPSKLQARTQPFDVASVVGACMAVRREAAERLGLFDEGYFYLYEETDFCRRARGSGWGVKCHPAIRVVHLQGRTRHNVRIPAKIEQARSRFLYFRRHHPVQYAILRAVYPFKSFLESVGWLAAAVATLGLWRPARMKLAESAVVWAWQMMGCPRGWGLSGSAPAPVSREGI
ncbi:MAG: glycosyltransferase family 2 protein [Planctomycetes bacterium]|nr:glycosyltransferase family 2 protein [Planctomycetota bacterium]